jgi:hypothetical protein
VMGGAISLREHLRTELVVNVMKFD